MKILVHALCDQEPLMESMKDHFEVVYSFEESFSNCLLSDILYSEVPAYARFAPDHVLFSVAERLRSVFAKNYIDPFYDSTEDVIGVFEKYIKLPILKIRESSTVPITVLGYGPLMSDPLGSRGYRTRPSPSESLLHMELAIRDLSRSVENVYYIPAIPNAMLSDIGLSNRDSPHFTHATSSDFLRKHLLTEWVSHIQGVAPHRQKKWIAIDLDNTLWNGTLREDGLEGLRPNIHRVDRLLCLMARGFVIWVVSKNDPADSTAVIDYLKTHAHFDPEKASLFTDQIAGWSLSWEDKASVISKVSSQIGLDLDQCIFIDDSPAERHIVKSSLPEVSVLSEIDFDVQFSRNDPIFETVTDGVLTQDASRRSSMYKENEKRRSYVAEGTSTQDLESVMASMKLTIEADMCSPSSIARVSELCARSNRQNISTKRRSTAELQEFIDAGGSVLHFRAADIFGDYGTVGAVLVKDSQIDTFALSCRLMGRSVEDIMIYVSGQEQGCVKLSLSGYKTEHNSSFINRLLETGSLVEEGSKFFTKELSSPPKNIDLRLGKALYERIQKRDPAMNRT